VCCQKLYVRKVEWGDGAGNSSSVLPELGCSPPNPYCGPAVAIAQLDTPEREDGVLLLSAFVTVLG